MTSARAYGLGGPRIVGTRFAGLSWGELRSTALIAIAWSVLMLLSAVIAAKFGSWLIGRPRYDARRHRRNDRHYLCARRGRGTCVGMSALQSFPRSDLRAACLSSAKGAEPHAGLDDAQ
jgi:hypothetical protein